MPRASISSPHFHTCNPDMYCYFIMSLQHILKDKKDIQTDRQTPDLAETAVPIPSAYFKTHMLILSDL